MNLKRTQNKLIRNGYLADVQTKTYEKWIDVKGTGTPISFYKRDNKIAGAFKIHGRRPDQPEVDEFNSDFTRNVSEAIRLSRV
tara:strand:+ start:952 stop:1200 length:249 start_codon:yes stop_codon:yes gene_type:complete